MISIVVVAIAVLFFVMTLILMVKYTSSKGLTCPHCGLEFNTDLFLIQDYALLSCPFCHRWILVKKSSDSYIANRLFTGK